VISLDISGSMRCERHAKSRTASSSRKECINRFVVGTARGPPRARRLSGAWRRRAVP
jgi:hypothetical protein